jgi:hypothetical protein
MKWKAIVIALLTFITILGLIIGYFLKDNKGSNDIIDIDKLRNNRWTKVEVSAQFPYKKRIIIKDEIIKQIIENLDYKLQDISGSLNINIKIYVEDVNKPIIFFISRGGWGINPNKGDCYSFKNNEKGERLYNSIFEKIANY